MSATFVQQCITKGCYFFLPSDKVYIILPETPFSFGLSILKKKITIIGFAHCKSQSVPRRFFRGSSRNSKAFCHLPQSLTPLSFPTLSWSHHSHSNQDVALPHRHIGQGSQWDTLLAPVHIIFKPIGPGLPRLDLRSAQQRGFPPAPLRRQRHPQKRLRRLRRTAQRRQPEPRSRRRRHGRNVRVRVRRDAPRVELPGRSERRVRYDATPRRSIPPRHLVVEPRGPPGRLGELHGRVGGPAVRDREGVAELGAREALEAVHGVVGVEARGLHRLGGEDAQEGRGGAEEVRTEGDGGRASEGEDDAAGGCAQGAHHVRGSDRRWGRRRR
mmetsp:Transcript_431/g.948  ORF Transcript_431/g.948 Transcript_431/m.948 type:complete len:328 (+) Transcript_431:3-986(+)